MPSLREGVEAAIAAGGRYEGPTKQPISEWCPEADCKWLGPLSWFPHCPICQKHHAADMKHKNECRKEGCRQELMRVDWRGHPNPKGKHSHPQWCAFHVAEFDARLRIGHEVSEEMESCPVSPLRDARLTAEEKEAKRLWEVDYQARVDERMQAFLEKSAELAAELGQPESLERERYPTPSRAAAAYHEPRTDQNETGHRVDWLAGHAWCTCLGFIKWRHCSHADAEEEKHK